MKLYFLRHGRAGRRSEWSGDDRLRPLTDEGRKRMVAEARRLAALDLGLDALVTSPLARAAQTAEAVAPALGFEDRVIEDERLAPGFSIHALAGILADHPDAAGLMLVGHEPDFSSVVGDLIGGAAVVLKKGGAARVDLTGGGGVARGDLRGQGELVWLAQPSLLLA